MYHGEYLLGWIFLGAVKRTQNVEDKIEAKQLRMELQSLKELNANMKKRLEEQEKSNSVGKSVIYIEGTLQMTVPYTQRRLIKITQGDEDEDSSSEHLLGMILLPGVSIEYYTWSLCLLGIKQLN